MAEKKHDKSKGAPKPAEERLFTIPLRKGWLKVPLNKRAKRSITTIRAHLSRHMKVPEADIKVSAKINDAIWIRGAGKPPAKIRLKASLDASTGLLHAMLPDEKTTVNDDKKEGKPEEPSTGEEKNAEQGTEKDKAEHVKAAVEKAVEKATSKEEVKNAVNKTVADMKATDSEEDASEKKVTEQKTAANKEKPAVSDAKKQQD